MPKVLFRVLLAVLGGLMATASRCSPAFRAQCTREMVVQVGSADGVTRRFVFGRRQMTTRSGPGADPTLTLTFASAGGGFRALSSPAAVRHIVTAMLGRRAEVRGNAVLLLWFYGLTRTVVPLGRERRLRDPLPDGFTAPDPRSQVADRITRSAPADALDPAWEAAVTAHQKMAMPRACAGRPVALW